MKSGRSFDPEAAARRKREAWGALGLVQMVFRAPSETRAMDEGGTVEVARALTRGALVRLLSGGRGDGAVYVAVRFNGCRTMCHVQVVAAQDACMLDPRLCVVFAVCADGTVDVRRPLDVWSFSSAEAPGAHRCCDDERDQS